MNIFFYLPAVLIFLLDQITKHLIAANLHPNQSIPIIKNVLHLTYVQNTGAAFGMLRGANAFLLVVGLVVLALVFYFHLRLPSRMWVCQLILGTIFGAALGNLLDRLRLGYVADFIDFRFWPVFNFADTFLNLGIAALVLMLISNKHK
jgi:signal peptidase II